MPNVMAARPNIGGALCESSVIPFLVARPKFWLTIAARVPCNKAANTGECKTLTQWILHLATWRKYNVRILLRRAAITRGEKCFTKQKPHPGRRKGRKMPFCPWCPWLCPSNSSESGTKHILHVNFSPIRSAVPEIFHTQRTTDWRRQKQNLPQFTECGKYDVIFFSR